MALAAKGGGAKMTEALAPVSALASATELKTGRPRWVWPPLPVQRQQCALIQYRDLTLKGHGRCFRPECGVEGVNPELKAEIGERGRGTWCDAPDHLRAILDGLLAMEGTLKRSNVVNSLCRA